MRVSVIANIRLLSSAGWLSLCLLFASPAMARVIEVAVGWTKPPYVEAKTDSGFEIELIRSVFTTLGESVKFVYVPYGRSQGLLSAGRVDVTLTLNERVGIPEEQLSDVYITYQNVALTLASRNIRLSSIKDLHGHTIVAFQNASVALGDEFQHASEKSPLYLELPEQKRQVEMLLLGNVAVAVMDINIFYHIRRELVDGPVTEPVRVHYLFPPSHYRAGFKDLHLKREFDRALADYQASEGYQQLIDKYQLQGQPSL